MATNAIDGMYYEFHIPLGLKILIEKLIVGQPARRGSAPRVSGSGTNREWFSQPRPGTDSTTEVITTQFRLPLSVNELGFDVLRVPCRVEAWYLDRQNNWRQIMDRQRSEISVPVQASAAASWYTYSTSIYPVIAQAVQIRITRTADAQFGSNPYVVGLKNTLMRRNVYDRSQGVLPFEEEQDALGNVISKYVDDWDASQAIDNKPFTFWKSAALPDPQAVCSLYLDTRDYQGLPQYMDGLFLDPVYTNQSLNIYYSKDDAVGSPRLSPITLRPDPMGYLGTWDASTNTPTLVNGTGNEGDLYLVSKAGSRSLGGGAINFALGDYVIYSATAKTWSKADLSIINDLNTDWRSGQGRRDSSSSPTGVSRYRVPAKWGPMVSQDIWIGLEWIPDFSAGSVSLPTNPVLLEVTPPTPRQTGQYTPKLSYDSGAGTIVLSLYDGTTTKNYPVALSSAVVKNKALRIVAGWSYGPDKVYISVQDRQGNQIALLDRTVPNTSPTLPALPTSVTLDGQVGFSSFRGTFTAHVIKRENYSGNAEAFLRNPIIYVDPDPVLANPNGTIPSTTLDRALYAVDWTMQEHGNGGAHESFYTEKEWQPIFADYITRRGKMFFPHAISAQYLKLEFTGLTEESYPIYDAGISVSYQVFPVEVSQTQTVNHPGLLGNISGLLTVGAQTLVGGFGTVNWLNPQTVATAINSVFGPVVNPVTVQVSPGYTTNSIPGTAQTPVSDTTRTEMSSPYIYRRGLLDPAALAGSHIYYSGFTTWSQTLSNANELFGDAIADSFSPLRSYVTNPTAGPVQGDDFWIFPGATLRMPAAVMNGLTALTETVVGRKPTTETRMRFTTNSIHRYETRTLKRDAAVAYFAGVREVQPILTSYIDAADPTVFRFNNYVSQQSWVLDNTRVVTAKSTTDPITKKLIAAPLTTAGRFYSIEGTDFDFGIDNWMAKSGTWVWDASTVGGRYYPGAAKVTASATGGNKELISTKIITYPESTLVAGETLTFKVYARWSGLTVTNNQPGIQLGLVTYKDGAVVSDTIVLAEKTFANWSANSSSTSGSGNNYVLLTNATPWAVPSNVDEVRVRLVVTEYATAGSVWFDNVSIASSSNTVGSAYQSFKTISSFAKLRCTFDDSGPVRSNSMWLRSDNPAVSLTKASTGTNNYILSITPSTTGGSYTLSYNGKITEKIFSNADADTIRSALAALPGIGSTTLTVTPAGTSRYGITITNTTSTLTVRSSKLTGGASNIDATALAYYTSWISLDLFTGGLHRAGGATWADPLAYWADDNVAWGSEESLVNITIDANRSYDGQRVLHFSRGVGAGEAGIRIRQSDNFVPGALYRICARWYKPFQNNNSITVRLRRLYDDASVFTQKIEKPAVGYWYEFATDFQSIGIIPDDNYVYNLELVTNGDEADEIYLSDLWVEISHVRYIVTLNGIAYDVTDLRYADTPIVSTPVGVTTFSVEARVYSPRAAINGCKIEPLYNYERNS